MYGIVRLYRVGHEFLMKSKLLLLGHFWPKLQPSSTWPHFDFEVYIIYGITILSTNKSPLYHSSLHVWNFNDGMSSSYNYKVQAVQELINEVKFLIRQSSKLKIHTLTVK